MSCVLSSKVLTYVMNVIAYGSGRSEYVCVSMFIYTKEYIHIQISIFMYERKHIHIHALLRLVFPHSVSLTGSSGGLPAGTKIQHVGVVVSIHELCS